MPAVKQAVELGSDLPVSIFGAVIDSRDPLLDRLDRPPERNMERPDDPHKRRDRRDGIPRESFKHGLIPLSLQPGNGGLGMIVTRATPRCQGHSCRAGSADGLA